MRRAFVLPVLHAACALGLAAPAYGASLQISPVLINLRPNQSAGSIVLQNLGERAIYGQVRVYAWEQRGGEDVLTPTDELVASPPIIEIAARTSQTIRLVRRGGASPGPERAYRLLIDEIPRNDELGNGVAIRLQYSVPVFVAPLDEAAAPALDWTVLRRDGAWMLQLKNSGSLHAQVGAATLVDGAGKEVELGKGLLGYALAGRTRAWRLALAPATALSGSVTIRADVNARPATAAGRVLAEDGGAR